MAALFVMAVALALSFAGRFGPPWPVIFLISLGLPAFALCALLTALTIGLSRPPHLRWLALIAGLIAAWLIFDSLRPMMWPQLPVPKGDARTIRIVEFNAWVLNREPGTATRWIESQRPDVIVLLEAAGTARSIVDQLTPAFPHQVSCRGTRPCSTIILSRWPLAGAKGLAHGDADNRRALSAAFARVVAPQGSVDVLAVHLSRPLMSEQQYQEINSLLSKTKNISSSRLVVAGDFNLPPWSRAMRAISDGLGVRDADGEQPSWPVPGTSGPVPAFWSIDHALLGPGWLAIRATRGPALGSDHYPLLMELAGSSADAH